MSFPARFQGWCPRCGGPIAKGQSVEFNYDDEVEHIGCEKVEKRGVVIVCNECFLEMPCECTPRWQFVGTKESGLVVKWVSECGMDAARGIVAKREALGFETLEMSQV